MNSKIVQFIKTKILSALVFISVFVLLFSLGGITASASSFEAGTYFEVDKIPIESVELITDSDSILLRGEVVQLSSVVYPQVAEETVIDRKYKIIDGADFVEMDNNNLIVSDSAPIGERIEVVSIVDGVESNSLVFGVLRTPDEIDVYKPAKSLLLSAMVNGSPLSDNNLPKSSNTTSDTVMLVSKVDDEASVNCSEIVVISGAEFIDGEIILVDITDDGYAYFEFNIKSGLGSLTGDRVIKICAIQDTVVTEELAIEIYITNDDFTLLPSNVDRGSIVELAPIHTPNATDKMWEFELGEDAVALGVTKNSGNYISIPTNLSAGTAFTVKYRLISVDSSGTVGEWEETRFTVSKVNDASNLVYNDILGDGFNFIYKEDSEGVDISENIPQLWVGRYVDIEVKYINDFIASYGMFIKSVTVSGPGYEDISARNENSFRVYMNSDATGSASITITITISDGNEEYVFDAGTIHTFRPMSGSLTFNTVTANGQNIVSLINRDGSTFDFSATYGISELKYSLLNPNGVEMMSTGNIKIKSYAAHKEQTVRYTYDEYYNDEKIEYVQTSCLNIKTVRVNKNGGTGGYDELVAVSGMANIVKDDLNTIAPTRSGYVIVGFDSYINSNGEVLMDYDCCDSINAIWLKTESTIVLSADNGHRDHKITDSDKYTETIYPYLNRENLKSYGYTELTITITFDCKEKDDGYQELWIYSHTDEQIAHFKEEHGSGYKDTNWWSHNVSFATSLDNVQTDGSFWIRWGAQGKFDDDWYLGYTKITVEAIK